MHGGPPMCDAICLVGLNQRSVVESIVDSLLQ